VFNLLNGTKTEKKYFCVDARKYMADADFFIFRPASIFNPKSNAVMFITKGNIVFSDAFMTVSGCLVYWPVGIDIPTDISSKHIVIPCKNPHLEYCKFFADNQITSMPNCDSVEMLNGAYISKSAVIGKHTTIFPCAYISGEIVIGDNCFIGAGVKIIGEVSIGNNVKIRENTVIGADSLTTDRDECGRAVTMPQFGGVLIEDEVLIGANSVIARGAIDNTFIGRGSRISNSVVISHNVSIGADTFIAGGTTMLGSSSTGDRTLISCNCVINNYAHIGEGTTLGMGSVVIRSIPAGKVAYGSPAKVIRDC